MHALRKYGRVPLPVRMRAAEDRDGAARIEADVHAIIEDAAELDVVADRAAAQLAALLRLALALAVTFPVRHLDTLVEQARELARVVGVERRRVVGKLVRRDQVDAPYLGDIHADFSRRMLDQPLGE